MRKLVFSLSALAIVAASQAAVHYHYELPVIFGPSLDVTTSTFITSSQSFNGSQVDSVFLFLSSFDSANFGVASGSNDSLDINGAFLGVFPFTVHDEFAEGAFGAYGTYSSLSGPGVLTVSNTAAAVPSPAAMIPFALGGLATLRKRRQIK